MEAYSCTGYSDIFARTAVDGSVETGDGVGWG